MKGSIHEFSSDLAVNFTDLVPCLLERIVFLNALQRVSEVPCKYKVV